MDRRLLDPNGGELKTELKSTKNNPLLKRKEIAFEIREPATPSRSEVRRDIAVLLKTDLERVLVKTLETKTGTNTTIGLAHIYDSDEAAAEVEPEHAILRNKTPEKQKESEE